MNEEPKKVSIEDEDEWTAAFQELSDDEQIDYTRNVIDIIRKNPAKFPGVTPQLIEDMEAKLHKYEQDVENEKVAHRKLAEATAALERSGDAYLAALGPGDGEKGH